MNKQQLDERIDNALDHLIDAAGYYHKGLVDLDGLDDEYEVSRKAVAQLISDVLDEVVPEKQPEKAPARLIHMGYNHAINAITNKRRELGL